MSEDHEIIYLEPECCSDDPDLGRTWCQDAVWDCEDGIHPTAYIRKDVYDAKLKRIEQLEAAIRDHRVSEEARGYCSHSMADEDLWSVLEEPQEEDT